MKTLLRAASFVAIAMLFSLAAQSASAQGCCKAGLCRIPQLPAASGASQVNSMLQQFDDARTPAREASAATARPAPASAATEISLSNPLGSNQKIEYVLDGKAYALDPGMSLSMKAAAARKIEFSRDGNGTKAAYRISRGAYEFTMTNNGWELYRAQR